MKRVSFLVLVAALATNLPSFARAAELVYFHSESCTVCERWNAEVGAIYGKTIEAKRLGLRRLSVHDVRPADLSFVTGVVYTPTFVVVEDGREVGRMVGYISDYFFWERVGTLIKRLDDRHASACQGSTGGAQRAAC